MIQTTDFMMKYNVTAAMAKMLLLLLNNKIVTAKMVEVDDPVTSDIKVLAHRIRRRMDGTGVKLQSRRSLGYWIDQESKEKIMADLSEGQMSLPLDHGVKSESPPLAA